VPSVALRMATDLTGRETFGVCWYTFTTIVPAMPETAANSLRFYNFGGLFSIAQISASQAGFKLCNINPTQPHDGDRVNSCP